MRNIRKVLKTAALIASLSFCSSGQANRDTVYRTNGDVLTGTILQKSPCDTDIANLKIQVESNKTVGVPYCEIVKIRRAPLPVPVMGE
jgi:hypothetical protein